MEILAGKGLDFVMKERLELFHQTERKAQMWAKNEKKDLEIHSSVIRTDPFTIRTTVILDGKKTGCEMTGPDSRLECLQNALRTAGIPID